MRWTTGIGIAVGGVGGAIAALLGAHAAPSPASGASVGEVASTRPPATQTPAAPSVTPARTAPAPASATPLAAEPAGVPTLDSAVAGPDSAAPAPSAAAPTASIKPASTVPAPPPLNVPASPEALTKAEVLCDQRQDFDACSAAAQALEQGTAGPVDLVQGKRFRRIALTHLVSQCEAASAHACFVLAAKYRAGTELANNPASAEALEKRGAELCRLGRSAPECPSP